MIVPIASLPPLFMSFPREKFMTLNPHEEKNARAIAPRYAPLRFHVAN